MWANFYANGGLGMYPTTIFGFGLVWVAALFALRLDGRYLSLVTSLGLLTFASGLLGTCVGVINSFRYAEQINDATQLTFVLAGCAESLNNIVLALLIITFTALLVSISILRAQRRPEQTGTL